jgi:catechol 2,3-dioxygenase-like lactoylglutathione lyase family enzyme
MIKGKRLIKTVRVCLLISSFIFVGFLQAQAVKVQSVGMTISNMEEAVDFYSNVLSFQKISDVELSGPDYEHLQGIFGLRMRKVNMKLGDEQIELTEYLTPRGRAIPVYSRSNDLWFQHIAIVVSDMDSAYKYLRKHNIQHVSTAPQTIPAWNKAAAGIKAFYFQDPDHHNLEIIYFPPGKSKAKWQRHKGQLFLGIDHTAIVVGSVERSLNFYQDLLGFKIAGESENYGTEQEHLNNVFGARLHITGLRAAIEGIGVEFLEYLTPATGRLYPADSQSNDLWHWETSIIVDNLDSLEETLLKNSSHLISSWVMNLHPMKFEFSKALLICDNDGHAVRLVEK